MNKEALPLIGLAIAAFIFLQGEGGVLPQPKPKADAMDLADDSRREEIARVFAEYKDADKTTATAEAIAKDLDASRDDTHAAVEAEIISLWWNDKDDELQDRVLNRKLTGVKEDTDAEDE